MNLVSRKNNPWFSSVFDDFFTPNWFGELQTRSGSDISVPAVNIKETKDRFYVELAVPGKKKEDFNIEVIDDVLTISSEGKKEHKEKNEEGHYTRREFRYSAFKRSFTLPETVDPEKIHAEYKEGVLKIDLPRKDVAVPNPKRLINVS